jgi:phosphatidylglycerol:prolipoprotein diacylglycerol transferase
MPGPFIHRIDPILFSFAGVHFWWYGLSYALGFFNMRLALGRERAGLGLTGREADALALYFCSGVLLGGRLVEVAFDEWAFYRGHPHFVPAVWLGGFATHGLLLGAAVATWLFARLHGLSLRALADALVIPGALLMGLGRVGNFIDGQIVGSLTHGWWGVQFPDSDGFRHPVVLYDGAKNLLLVPYLAYVRRTVPTPGATAARFVFWYAFLRIFIDLARDYPTHRLALGTGQTLNVAMTCLGAGLLVRSRLRRQGRLGERRPPLRRTDLLLPARAYRPLFAALLVVSLTIPSNWTQDVPARYGTRHPGLEHSWLYPAIDTRPGPSPRTVSVSSSRGVLTVGGASAHLSAPASIRPTSAPPDFETNEVSTGTALPTRSGFSPSLENADAALARSADPLVPVAFDTAPIAAPAGPPPVEGAALSNASIPGTALDTCENSSALRRDFATPNNAPAAPAACSGVAPISFDSASTSTGLAFTAAAASLSSPFACVGLCAEAGGADDSSRVMQPISRTRRQVMSPPSAVAAVGGENARARRSVAAPACRRTPRRCSHDSLPNSDNLRFAVSIEHLPYLDAAPDVWLTRCRD